MSCEASMPHHLSTKCRLYTHQMCPNQLQSEIQATLKRHYKASTVLELKNFMYFCLIIFLVLVSIRFTLCDFYTKSQESQYVNAGDKLHIHVLHNIINICYYGCYCNHYAPLSKWKRQQVLTQIAQQFLVTLI